MKVTLTVHGKERDGEIFEFKKPGSFLFGSSKHAQCRITGDPYVSRSHFYLVVDPGDVRLCDLQSTNGTEVDGVLYTGGKGTEPSGEEDHPTFVKGEDFAEGEEVLLHDGSVIEAGYTRITVAIKADPRCSACGAAISAGGEEHADEEEVLLCEQCRENEKQAQAEQARRDQEHQQEELAKAHEQAHRLAEQRMARENRIRAARLLMEGQRLLLRGRKTEALRVLNEAASLDPGNAAIAQAMRRAQALPPRGAVRSPQAPGGSDEMMRRVLRNLGMAAPKGPIPDLPDYTIVRKIKQGGMGAVFEATSHATNQKVAIKVIIPENPITEAALKRFRREILITQELRHPHIVKTIDGNRVGDHLWLALEFIDRGWDVQKEMRERGGRIPLMEAVRYILQALEGLACAHRHKARIVHRDIKPPNILLARDSSGYIPKLSDFGLAKCLEESELNGSIVTARGMSMGTLPYMPPEQVVDVTTAEPPADVFSMGATLYHMLTGKLIRDFARTQNVMIRQVVQEKVIPIEKRNPRIPMALAHVINKSLHLEPAGRYRDGVEFKEALEAVVESI